MNRNKRLFHLIWLLALLPVFIAWSLAFFGNRLDLETKNHGELVPMGLQLPSNFRHQFEGKWNLLVLSKDCPDSCQKQVYRLQQLHTALGQNLQRVQPLWLSDDSTRKLPADINYSQVKLLAEPGYIDWFNQHNLQWQDHSIWLIDPKGNLVMRFSPKLTGKAMLADINWLLKASHIG